MKIYGIGTDIVNITRLKKAIKKYNRNFKLKIFSQTEILYCENKKDPLASYAKRFAAILMKDSHHRFGGTIWMLRNCHAHLVATSCRKHDGINDLIASGSGEKIFRTHVICDTVGFRPPPGNFSFRVIHHDPR